MSRHFLESDYSSSFSHSNSNCNIYDRLGPPGNSEEIESILQKEFSNGENMQDTTFINSSQRSIHELGSVVHRRSRTTKSKCSESISPTTHSSVSKKCLDPCINESSHSIYSEHLSDVECIIQSDDAMTDDNIYKVRSIHHEKALSPVSECSFSSVSSLSKKRSLARKKNSKFHVVGFRSHKKGLRSIMDAQKFKDTSKEDSEKGLRIRPSSRNKNSSFRTHKQKKKHYKKSKTLSISELNSKRKEYLKEKRGFNRSPTHIYNNSSATIDNDLKLKEQLSDSSRKSKHDKNKKIKISKKQKSMNENIPTISSEISTICQTDSNLNMPNLIDDNSEVNDKIESFFQPVNSNIILNPDVCFPSFQPLESSNDSPSKNSTSTIKTDITDAKIIDDMQIIKPRSLRSTKSQLKSVTVDIVKNNLLTTLAKNNSSSMCVSSNSKNNKFENPNIISQVNSSNFSSTAANQMINKHSDIANIDNFPKFKANCNIISNPDCMDNINNSYSKRILSEPYTETNPDTYLGTNYLSNSQAPNETHSHLLLSDLASSKNINLKENILDQVSRENVLNSIESTHIDSKPIYDKHLKYKDKDEIYDSLSDIEYDNNIDDDVNIVNTSFVSLSKNPKEPGCLFSNNANYSLPRIQNTSFSNNLLNSSSFNEVALRILKNSGISYSLAGESLFSQIQRKLSRDIESFSLTKMDNATLNSNLYNVKLRSDFHNSNYSDELYWRLHLMGNPQNFKESTTTTQDLAFSSQGIFQEISNHAIELYHRSVTANSKK